MIIDTPVTVKPFSKQKSQNNFHIRLLSGLRFCAARLPLSLSLPFRRGAPRSSASKGKKAKYPARFNKVLVF
jgi:hypothetical protein